jgi:hypothetical protein
MDAAGCDVPFFVNDDSLVTLGHLEGPLQYCDRCSLGRLAMYWTRDLEAHIVSG